ncbi:hypothetical protein, partial [Cronobacter sakazakii]
SCTIRTKNGFRSRKAMNCRKAFLMP